MNPMLCGKCKVRKAPVHYVKMVHIDKVEKQDLCDECARTEAGESGGNELPTFLEGITSGPKAAKIDWEKFVGKSARYPLEAYEFVAGAFEKQVRSAIETGKTIRTESAPAVLNIVREFAVAKFGKGAKAALAKWKISGPEDLGEILTTLARLGMFPAPFPQEDYVGGLDFDEAFPEE